MAFAFTTTLFPEQAVLTDGSLNLTIRTMAMTDSRKSLFLDMCGTVGFGFVEFDNSISLKLD